MAGAEIVEQHTPTTSSRSLQSDAVDGIVGRVERTVGEQHGELLADHAVAVDFAPAGRTRMIHEAVGAAGTTPLPTPDATGMNLGRQRIFQRLSLEPGSRRELLGDAVLDCAAFEFSCGFVYGIVRNSRRRG